MPIVPGIVTMAVWQSRAWRIVISITRFDDAIWVGQQDSLVHGLEYHEDFFGRGKAALRTSLRIGKPFIDVGHHHCGRMGSYQPLHLFCLLDCLRKLVDPDGTKKWKISLVQHAQHVAVIIDFFLHRPLGKADKIHVAEFGQQDIIPQLVPVFSHHIILLKAHGIGASQPDWLSIEEHSSFGNIDGIHAETSHAKTGGLHIQQLMLLVI